MSDIGNRDRFFINFGSGWISKNQKTGAEFINCKADPERTNYQLIARDLRTGEEYELNQFAGNWNDKKQTDKSPDLGFSALVPHK